MSGKETEEAGQNPEGESTRPIKQLADAYRNLQIAVGFVAITLCPIVIITDHLYGDQGNEMRDSVSHYYYGVGRNWFVGGLIAMAVFFLTYEYKQREPDRRVDNVHSTFGAVCALGVALFPTSEFKDPKGVERVVNHVHTVSAALLFCTLAIFALFHFTKSDSEVEPTNIIDRLKRLFRTDWIEEEPEKRPKHKVIRNRVFRFFGWTIVAALIAAAVDKITSEEPKLFLWAEVVAITAFGCSWLVKGELWGMFKDPEPSTEVEPADTGPAGSSHLVGLPCSRRVGTAADVDLAISQAHDDGADRANVRAGDRD